MPMNDFSSAHTAVAALDATRAAPGDDALESAISRATDAILADQRPDGHWVYELEADATIPAAYILLVHYLGETPNAELERKIVRYLRRIQLDDGGWPLFTDGALDISASVKAYFALKMAGEPESADHMQRARRAILAAGGAEAVNVFTRILLALYGVMPWRAVPMMPVEIALLPQWFPFHLSKVSYWARTVIVPLLVLNARRPVARNPRGVRIDELFRGAPGDARLLPRAPHQSKGWFAFFRAVDSVLRVTDRLFPKATRQRAIEAAVAFVDERLNGEDGLGAIFPAMANAVMMYDTLGYPPDHPNRAIARASIEKLLVIGDDEAYCQPCLSPVWDTSLAAHALLETELPRAEQAALLGIQWLRPLQILDVRGDWISRRPNVRPGGGHSSMRIRTTPMSTIRLSLPWRWSAQRSSRAPTWTARRSHAHASGWSACRAATADGAPSSPKTRITTSTTFRSPTTVRCSIRRRPTCQGVVCRCSRSSASCRPRASLPGAPTTTCSTSRRTTAAGTAAGA